MVITSRERLLWVTRSSPFNLLTAQRLRAMGYGVFTAPLFDILPLNLAGGGKRPDLIAFTSVNGVRHHPHQPAWNSVPVFTVGDATAAAARRSGYQFVRSARGNVHDLQALILRSAATGSRLIHYSAQEAAGDLTGYLQGRGFEAERRNVYEAHARPLGEMRSLLSGRAPPHGVVVHSPRAGQRTAELVSETGWSGIVFCLSKACARAFHDLPRVVVVCAPHPTERSLMETIRSNGSNEASARSLDLAGLKVVVGSNVTGALRSDNDNDGLEPTPA